MLELIEDIRELQEDVRRLKAGSTTLYNARGTWTPAYAGTGTAGTFTYSVQVGFYTVIDRLVFVQFHVAISAISVAPTTSMTITGLPLTPASDTNSHHGVTFATISNFNYSASALQLTGRIPPGDARIFLFESFDNAVTANAPAANFTNAACQLIGVGFYMI